MERDSKLFPGERIKGMALPPATDIASSYQNASWIQPSNRRRLAEIYNQETASEFFDRNDSAQREELSRQIAAAYDFSNMSVREKKAAELAAYTEFELVRPEALAIPFALSAFQAVNLGNGDLPLIIRPQSRQYFNVNYCALDGSPKQDQWRHTKNAEQILMRNMSTSKVEYPLYDLQQGDVNEYDRIQNQLRFDMDMKIDEQALAQIDGACQESGLQSILDIHPRIDVANIPDGNYLNLTNTVTYGAANTWTLARLKALLSHINRFGQGVTPEGGMTISSIIYSPQNVEDWWDFVDLVSGFNSSTPEQNPKNVVPTPVREQIFNTGMMNSAWGHSWTSIPNAVIPKGTMYVFTNQPIGWFFTKTGYDRLIRWEGPDQIAQNMGQVQWSRAFQFATVDLWKYRFVKVVF